MCEFPFYRRYPRDFIADTQHLCRADRGSYNSLLDVMWLEGGRLPFDHRALARIATVSPRQWPDVWARLARFFAVSADGLWISQRRMTAELQAAREQAEKQSGKAKRRWAPGGETKPDLGESPKLDLGESPKPIEPNPLKNNTPTYAAASPPARAVPEPEDSPLLRAGESADARAGKKIDEVFREWEPDPPSIEYGIRLGLTPAEIEDEALAFQDWNLAKGLLPTDIDAAFRSWLRKVKQFRPRRTRAEETQAALEAIYGPEDGVGGTIIDLTATRRRAH